MIRLITCVRFDHSALSRALSISVAIQVDRCRIFFSQIGIDITRIS